MKRHESGTDYDFFPVIARIFGISLATKIINHLLKEARNITIENKFNPLLKLILPSQIKNIFNQIYNPDGELTSDLKIFFDPNQKMVVRMNTQWLTKIANSQQTKIPSSSYFKKQFLKEPALLLDFKIDFTQLLEISDTFLNDNLKINVQNRETIKVVDLELIFYKEPGTENCLRERFKSMIQNENSLKKIIQKLIQVLITSSAYNQITDKFPDQEEKILKIIKKLIIEKIVINQSQILDIETGELYNTTKYKVTIRI